MAGPCANFEYLLHELSEPKPSVSPTKNTLASQVADHFKAEFVLPFSAMHLFAEIMIYIQRVRMRWLALWKLNLMHHVPLSILTLTVSSIKASQSRMACFEKAEFATPIYLLKASIGNAGRIGYAEREVTCITVASFVLSRACDAKSKPSLLPVRAERAGAIYQFQARDPRLSGLLEPLMEHRQQVKCSVHRVADNQAFL